MWEEAKEKIFPWKLLRESENKKIFINILKVKILVTEKEKKLAKRRQFKARE